MDRELARDLGVSVNCGNLPHRGGEHVLKQFVAGFGNGRHVIAVVDAKLLELLLPGATFRCLDAHFLSDAHQMAVRDHAIDQRAQVGAEGALVDR